MINFQNQFLWGKKFSAVCLSGAALLIMTSGRLAHAIIAFDALLWIYSLSALAARAAVKILPVNGRQILLVFLASFTAAVFLLLLWFLSPLCAIELFFIVSLIPLLCVTSGLFSRLENKTPFSALSSALCEAAVLGSLIIIFALIREPFGFLSLSLPGGPQGIILLFSFESEALHPAQIIASSSGALLLLGYFWGLYRYIKTIIHQPREERQ